MAHGKAKADRFPMPTNIPLHWATDWRFKVFADHVRFAFGHSGVMHDFVGMPLQQAIEMHQQLGNEIANVLRGSEPAEEQKTIQ